MDFFNEGNKFYNKQDYKRAIELYKTSIESKQNEACSYYNAGVCYIKLKKYDNAIEMIQKALSFQRDSKYYFNIGYCHSMKNNTNKALIYFNLAWALNNDDKDCEKAINLLTSKLTKK